MAGSYSKARGGVVCGELQRRGMIMRERRFGARFLVIGISLGEEKGGGI